MQRKICILIILGAYLGLLCPPLMGWFNRNQMLLGVPIFLWGVLLLTFIMLGTLVFLYLREEKGEDDHHE